MLNIWFRLFFVFQIHLLIYKHFVNTLNCSQKICLAVINYCKLFCIAFPLQYSRPSTGISKHIKTITRMQQLKLALYISFCKRNYCGFSTLHVLLVTVIDFLSHIFWYCQTSLLNTYAFRKWVYFLFISNLIRFL